MGALYRLIDFYRAQAELIWNWRRGRTQLLGRALISFVVATISLALTAWALPGLRIDTPLALAGAVITIGLLAALVRPVLLAVVAPISLTLMFLTALVFQVAAIVAVGPLVPGFRLNGVTDAVIAAAVFAIISSTLSWLLSLGAVEVDQAIQRTHAASLGPATHPPARFGLSHAARGNCDVSVR